MVWRVILEVILRSFWTLFWTLLRKPHHFSDISLHRAVGRALRLNIAQLWVLGWCWVVPGIVPLPAHPAIPHPGYTSPTAPGTPPSWAYCSARYSRVNMVVGLISVARLSLGAHFSVFQGFTEGYNLVRIRRINNHLAIPGND